VPEPGRPPKVDVTAVVLTTLEPPPERLGVTHWSSRLLADRLGISNVWITRIWRKWELQPWKRETFKSSTDPELEANIRDVVGLYLNPPEQAVVLSTDERSRIQALGRTLAILPMRPGLPERVSHDYVRHDITTLFAALEVATGTRITMHFTPASGSWLNMVEIFFGIISRQAIRRGTFTSVKDLIVAIEAFVDGWNQRCHPFT
jgi:hypothetical protein